MNKLLICIAKVCTKILQELQVRHSREVECGYVGRGSHRFYQMP